jgi:hypothetical protein
MLIWGDEGNLVIDYSGNNNDGKLYGNTRALFKFDEGLDNKTYDSSSYSNNGMFYGGNDGTLYNGSVVCADPPTSGAGCPKWVDGKFGKALSFDGVDDYMDISHSDSIMPTSAITVEAWVNTQQKDVWQGIVGKNNNTYPYYYGGYWLGITYANTFRFWIDIGGTPQTVGSTDIINLNTWYHVVGVYDGSTVKIYVDGILKGSTSATGSITAVTTSLRIGYTYDGSRFNGLIDEVRIYNRALSEEEIKQHFATPPPTITGPEE